MSDGNQRGSGGLSNLRGLAALGLAGGLYILLLDAALETFLSKSPVRWWVVIVAAVYLGANAALGWRSHPLWQRSGWSTKATISFFVLLTLLALTVWLPGGLTQGLKLFGLSTSTLLAAVTAVAVAYAGVMLLRPSYPHPAIRWVIAALAAYGVIAFLWAIYIGTSYSALFHGDSFWSRVPRWLQGGFIGAVVIVPAALIYKLANMLQRRGTIEFDKWGFEQVVALGLTLVMVISGFTTPAGFRGSQLSAGQIPAPASISTKNLQAFTNPKNLPAALDALEKLNASTSPSSFDVNAKAAELGRDVDKIFSFVRDQVRYEVYEGVLRGPQGTLMGMAGNSYDKSLLLAALLKQNGYELRFARGRLTEERGKALVAQMFAAFKEEGAAPGPAPAPANLPDAAAAAKEFADVVMAHWQESVEAVRSALERDKVRLGQTPPVPDKGLINEAMEHLWVEYRQGDKWVALDPSTKGARPGESFAASQQTLGTVPLALFHRVTVKVMVEERVSGRVTVSEALRHQATAADFNGASVSLSFKLSPAGADWSAVPVLQVEDKVITGRVVAGSGLAGGAQNLGRQLFARPGQLPQGGPSEQTAAWIDFDFTYPSGRVATVRREIFDRIGPAARVEKREADAPMLALDQTEGIPLYLWNMYGLSFCAGPLSQAAMAAKTARHVGALRAVLPMLSKFQASGGEPSAEDANQLSTTLGPALPDLSSLPASSFHLYSQKSLAVLQKSRTWSGVRFYEATPRLAIASFEAGLAGDGKTMTGRATLDLRRNELRVVAESVPGQQMVWVNAIRGILDGVLEHVMFANLTPRLRGQEGPISTISVMERARGTKTPLATLTSPERVHNLPAPEAAKARMAASLGDNVALIAPVRAILFDGRERLGWWRVDLQSGESLSVMDTGLHQTSDEKAFQEHMRKIYKPLWDDVIIFVAFALVLPVLVYPFIDYIPKDFDLPLYRFLGLIQ